VHIPRYALRHSSSRTFTSDVTEHGIRTSITRIQGFPVRCNKNLLIDGSNTILCHNVICYQQMAIADMRCDLYRWQYFQVSSDGECD
jgi:hypothetical protein